MLVLKCDKSSEVSAEQLENMSPMLVTLLVFNLDKFMLVHVLNPENQYAVDGGKMFAPISTRFIDALCECQGLLFAPLKMYFATSVEPLGLNGAYTFAADPCRATFALVSELFSLIMRVPSVYRTVR